MDEVIIYIIRRARGHHYIIGDDNNPGVRIRVEETTTVWDKIQKQIRTYVDSYDFDDYDNSGLTPPDSWALYPTNVPSPLASYVPVDSYVVPSAGPGYDAAHVGEKRFVFHMGHGNVRFIDCALQIALNGAPLAPGEDEERGRVVFTITGGPQVDYSATNSGEVDYSIDNVLQSPSLTATSPQYNAAPGTVIPGPILTTMLPGSHTIRAWSYLYPFCTAELAVTVPPRAGFSFNDVVTSPVAGETEGRFRITILGGYHPTTLGYKRQSDSNYTFVNLPPPSPTYRTWQSPQLAPGVYDILVSDGQSGVPAHEYTRTVRIVPPPPQSCIMVPEVVVLAPLLGETLGEISVTVRRVNSTTTSNGTTLNPVEVEVWRVGETTALQTIRLTTSFYTKFQPLLPGVYKVVATDTVDRNCTVTVNSLTIPEPPPSHYSFLPWVKQTLAKEATVGTGLRPTINMQVNTQVTTGSTTSMVHTPMDLELNGPGDITGFHYEAVLKTTPVADEQRFSPLELAAIEFKDEDLPWRYSPAGIDSSDRTTPWCFLLALEESEYQLQEQNNRPMPVVRIQNGPLLPATTQMWPWAHVQVNKNLGTAGSSTPSTVTSVVAEDFLNRDLPLNPSLAFSRVLSARRLKPNTRYRAFLLPSFETGRLAGLGQPVAASSADALAWDGKAANADLDFPVYYQWAFQTGADENFEALARLLKPRVLTPKPAMLAVVLPLNSASAPLASGQQARQAGPTTPSGPLALPMPAVVEPWGTASVPPPAAVVNELYTELSLGLTPPATSPRNRPVVTPPVYGRAYASSDQLTNPQGSIPANWKYEVNLDPRYRAIASLGSQAVQERQEEFMQRAWAQVKDLMAVNHNLRNLQLSLQATSHLRNKHLPVVAATTSYAVNRSGDAAAAAQGTAARGAVNFAFTLAEETPAVVEVSGMENYGLQLTALGQARTRDAATGLTVRENIRRSDIPQAVFSPAFRRIMRPFGRYQMGQAGKPLRPSEDEPANVPANLLGAPTSLRQRDLLISLLQAKELRAADPKPDAARIYQFEDRVLDSLTKAGETPAALHLQLPDQAYQVIEGGPALAAFTSAYTDFRESLTFLTPVEVKSPLPLDTVKEQVAVATFPDAVLTARVDETVKQTSHTEPGDFMADDFYAGDFQAGEESILAALTDAGTAPAQRSASSPAGVAARSATPQATLAGPGPIDKLPLPVAPATNVLKPVMAYPVFSDAMGDILRKTHPELFLPNLADFPANSVALLQINRQVIEAYMLGVNHAFGSELLWREFPTDLRGSYFQQFWDASEYVNMTPPGNRTPRQIEEDNLDIRALDQWGSNRLGSNKQANAPVPGTLLAIRAELLRRYPNTVVCLKAAKSVPGVPGHWQPDDAHTSYPIGRLALGQDVLALSFALPHDQLVDPANGGYFIVFMERPGEPQFGLDELALPVTFDGTANRSNQPAIPTPTSWNDLSWDYMGTPRGSNLVVDPAAKPQVSAGAVQHTTNSAQLAYALLREPVMVAIPAYSLIEIPSPIAPII